MLNSSWGLTRRGHSALVAALAIGTPLASTVGILSFTLNHRDAALAITLAAAALAPCIMLGWVAVVDRSSVAGALKNPDQSIESTWYDRATRGAFHDMLIAMGLALVALSAVPALRHVSSSLTLTVTLAAVTLDVVVRYQLLAHRER